MTGNARRELKCLSSNDLRCRCCNVVAAKNTVACDLTVNVGLFTLISGASSSGRRGACTTSFLRQAGAPAPQAFEGRRGRLHHKLPASLGLVDLGRGSQEYLSGVHEGLAESGVGVDCAGDVVYFASHLDCQHRFAN